MSRIQQLSASVINKIAAGEVIERPASVVKELLENSLDALASRIDVDVMAGGSELIRIVDDGEGIHPDDLVLSVASHATSKIRNADDLFEVQTMGFRGEALASVAEVSRLRIRTRQAGASHGMELNVELGEVGKPIECGCPFGTQIEIRNLFENTPVRRKFLKTVSTEFGHISEQFARVALANPRLHMVLRHNEKLVYELPSSLEPIDRLKLFFGKELAEGLIPVQSEQDGVRMWGYIGHPNNSKSTRKQQYLFLNGRCIQDRSLQYALTEAYRGLLMVGRQPVAFLFLEVPPDRVDVNVHPTKVEVRFQDGQQLFRQLLSMIRTKFLSLDLQSQLRLPQASPSSAPTSLSGFTSSLPKNGERQGVLTSEFSDWMLGRIAPDSVGTSTPASATSLNSTIESASVSRNNVDVGMESTPPDADATFRTSNQPHPVAFQTDPGVDSNWDHVAETPNAPDSRFVVESCEEGIRDSSRLTSESTSEQKPFVPSHRAMQIHDCYLVVETPEGITVIDQHALHERIMYEHLRERVLAGAVESQRLLVPQPVEVTAKEASLLLEQSESLDKVGLGVEDFGNGTILVSRYPAMLNRVDIQSLVRSVIEMLDGASGVQTSTRRDILDSLLHMMSCKAAVKAGQRLSQDEIESLLMQRHLIDDAHHCPHGRPTALSLSRAELDRQFGRLG